MELDKDDDFKTTLLSLLVDFDTTEELLTTLLDDELLDCETPLALTAPALNVATTVVDAAITFFSPFFFIKIPLLSFFNNTNFTNAVYINVNILIYSIN